MAFDLSPLDGASRLLLEATLKPVQGDRFQPTGFPDLGPAEYLGPDESTRLLVESAQSMANRLEAVCWDDASDDLVEPLRGLPYVRVDFGDGSVTASLLEFHRLNSPYIIDAQTGSSETFKDVLTRELGLKQARKTKEERAAAKQARKGKTTKGTGDTIEAEAHDEGGDIPGVVNFRKLAAVAFRYDPNSLIHGFFLEKVAGRLRIPRLLSAFVDASGVRSVTSGGVKFDRVDPTGDTASGRGNVPFHRTEFVADEIKACFNLDLAQLRGFGLRREAEELLIVFALWKINRFLETGLRLRTACDLDLVSPPEVKRPANFTLPETKKLESVLPTLIDSCRNLGLFAAPPVTRLSGQFA